mmetsp:Transcript_49680/g.131042  ORF Transcript_49680/g.131042 Transcript_49680/m.131042 type:complete len:253 (+) Transcript_49680:1232-1990(+)
MMFHISLRYASRPTDSSDASSAMYIITKKQTAISIAKSTISRNEPAPPGTRKYVSRIRTRKWGRTTPVGAISNTSLFTAYSFVLLFQTLNSRNRAREALSMKPFALRLARKARASELLYGNAATKPPESYAASLPWNTAPTSGVYVNWSGTGPKSSELAVSPLLYGPKHVTSYEVNRPDNAQPLLGCTLNCLSWTKPSKRFTSSIRRRAFRPLISSVLWSNNSSFSICGTKLVSKNRHISSTDWTDSKVIGV